MKSDNTSGVGKLSIVVTHTSNPTSQTIWLEGRNCVIYEKKCVRLIYTFDWEFDCATAAMSQGLDRLGWDKWAIGYHFTAGGLFFLCGKFMHTFFSPVEAPKTKPHNTLTAYTHDGDQWPHISASTHTATPNDSSTDTPVSWACRQCAQIVMMYSVGHKKPFSLQRRRKSRRCCHKGRLLYS